MGKKRKSKEKSEDKEPPAQFDKKKNKTKHHSDDRLTPQKKEDCSGQQK